MSDFAAIKQQMAAEQSARYHQEALQHGSEVEWSEAVAVAKTETANERVELITVALRGGGLMNKIRYPSKNLGTVATLARLSEYTLAGGDPEYFTRGAGGAGGPCVIV